MMLITMKYILASFLIIGLLFSSGVFSLMLYYKVAGKQLVANPNTWTVQLTNNSTETAIAPPVPEPDELESTAKLLKKSAFIDAPLVLQKPEFPSGCEIVALTMMLQFYGIQITKMQLEPEMTRDPTPNSIQ
jgi:hypothetical protein